MAAQTLAQSAPAREAVSAGKPRSLQALDQRRGRNVPWYGTNQLIQIRSLSLFYQVDEAPSF
jgi:hypothetical protein